MALIWTNVCRFSVVGSYIGTDCVNVFDIRVDPQAGSATSRGEAIPEIGGDLLNQWSDHIMPLLSDGYVAREVRWVDLDTANGATGSTSSTDGSTWPANGSLTSPSLPANVYAKVVKRLASKTRTQRNGMVRLGGLVESQTTSANPNVLDPAFISSLNAAFENLKDGIQGFEDLTSTDIGVLHTVDNVATGFSPISNFDVEPVVGTIRRRMPGYGA